MNETSYEPLNPSPRASINSSINSDISKLKACERSGLTNIQIATETLFKNMINNLPDGFLMPMERRK